MSFLENNIVEESKKIVVRYKSLARYLEKKFSLNLFYFPKFQLDKSEVLYILNNINFNKSKLPKT